MSDSKFYHISRDGKLIRVSDLAESLVLVGAGGFLWLDYCQPTKDDLSALINPLGFHSLPIEDCLDENQIPKIEDYPGHTFIIFNAFDCSDNTLSVHEVDVFVGTNFLVTVSGRYPDNRPVLSDIGHLAELDIAKVRKGPAFLLHVILNHIVDRKFETIESLGEELDNIEDMIVADPVHFNPRELLRMRRQLLTLRKCLFHEREILVKICRKDSLFISDKAIIFYRDIYDHLTKFFELTESSRELVTSLMEIYLSMLNNQMAKSANEMNAAVRRLTFITTIFMPLTLFAGIGGMSEWSMITGPENWKISYPAFLLLMIFIGAASYYFLKWLEKTQ